MKYYHYNEKKQHGTKEYPAAYYSVDERYPQYEMPLHWHKEWELIYVREGKLTLYINNAPIDVLAGESALIVGGSLHRGEPENSRYDCFVFDPTMLLHRKEDLLSPILSHIISEMSIGLSLHYSCNAPMTVLIASLMDNMQTSAPEYIIIKNYSLLLDIFYELSKHSYEKSKKGVHISSCEKLLKLLSWMELHYHEPINLDTLSGIAGWNKKYLCRIFKEYTAQTPIMYLNELRIHFACYEILRNELSITQIAYECGFNDSGYFSKIFKKSRGLSPYQYRQKNGQIKSDHNLLP